MVSLLPDDGIGVVVLANLNGTPLPTIVARQASDRMLGLEPVDWNGRTLKRREVWGVQADESARPWAALMGNGTPVAATGAAMKRCASNVDTRLDLASRTQQSVRGRGPELMPISR